MDNVEPERLRQLYRAIDASRDVAVQLLLELVRAPSVTGREELVQDVVEPAMRSRGLEVDRWEPSAEQIAPYRDHVGYAPDYRGRPVVVGRLPGMGGGRSILLNAHIDTVDPGDPAMWTRDPAGEVDGDLVYGRGACDMKGGLVTYFVALDALAAAGIRLRGDVTIAATTGEEDGGVGALATVLRGYHADAALIPEPTRLALVTAQEGSLVFRLTVQGKSAHAAVRDEGVSALEKFIPIFQDLQAFERERNQTLQHPLYDGQSNKVPVNVGVVRAGEWASTVPESLTAEVRIGFLPGEDLYEFWDVVRRRILDVADRDPWLREHPPVMEWFGGQFAAAETPVDAPIVRAVARAHELVTGSPVAIVGVPYGADLRLFQQFGGMPCVMYGAGDVRVAHQADEHIDVRDLLTAARTIGSLLVEWCGTLPDPG
jgi:acetylornithine deacetylase